MPGPVHVAQVIATLEPGGAELQLLQLTRGLIERGYRISVVALTRGGALEKKLSDAGAGVCVVGKKVKLDLRALSKLTRTLEILSPDIVHTHMFTSNTYGRLAIERSSVRAVVATEHSMGPEKTLAHHWIDRFLARRTHAITCPTRAIATRLASRGVPAEKIHVIPNAVRIAELRQLAEAVERPAVTACPTEARESRLIAVARLDPVKELPVLIEATVRLLNAGKRVKLTLVGDGPDRPRIEQAAKRANRLRPGTIELTGHHPNPALLLKASDIFCLPSRSEGLPTAVLESMALGLPVVASRLPGIEEVVADGETGLLVEPRDPVRLADAIGRLLDNPSLARDFGAAGLKRARRLFDAPVAIEAHHELYQRLLARSCLKSAGVIGRDVFLPEKEAEET